jgi:hypothetical protein
MQAIEREVINRNNVVFNICCSLETVAVTLVIIVRTDHLSLMLHSVLVFPVFGSGD